MPVPLRFLNCCGTLVLSLTVELERVGEMVFVIGRGQTACTPSASRSAPPRTACPVGFPEEGEDGLLALEGILCLGIRILPPAGCAWTLHCGEFLSQQRRWRCAWPCQVSWDAESAFPGSTSALPAVAAIPAIKVVLSMVVRRRARGGGGGGDKMKGGKIKFRDGVLETGQISGEWQTLKII